MNCIDNCYSHTQIGVLFTRFDVEPTGGNKLNKSTALVSELHERGDNDSRVDDPDARPTGGRASGRFGTPALSDAR